MAKYAISRIVTTTTWESYEVTVPGDDDVRTWSADDLQEAIEEGDNADHQIVQVDDDIIEVITEIIAYQKCCEDCGHYHNFNHTCYSVEPCYKDHTCQPAIPHGVNARPAGCACVSRSSC